MWDECPATTDSSHDPAVPVKAIPRLIMSVMVDTLNYLLVKCWLFTCLAVILVVFNIPMYTQVCCKCRCTLIINKLPLNKNTCSVYNYFLRYFLKMEKNSYWHNHEIKLLYIHNCPLITKWKVKTWFQHSITGK